MEELAVLVSKKTGLSKEQSIMALKVVFDFLKTKLPAPVMAQVNAVLNRSGALGTVASVLDDGKIDASDAATLLGNLFDNKK